MLQSKIIILFFLVFYMVACKEKKKPISYGEFSIQQVKIDDSIRNHKIDSVQHIVDSLQVIDDSLCKQRGHIYTPPIDVSPILTEKSHLQTIINQGRLLIVNGGDMYFGPYSTTTSVPKLQLIDTNDSSYILEIPVPVTKHCYRCDRDIDFPQKPIFKQLIWKRN